MPRSKKRPAKIDDVPRKARRLLELPNVGPATALDLVKLGISDAKDLLRRDPDQMYELLSKIDRVRHDPCVRDVFASVIAFVNGAPARPWWHYTPERKARLSARPRPARPSGKPRPRSR